MAILIKKLVFISALATGSLLLTIVLTYYLASDVAEQAELLNDAPPIIVLKTFHSYAPGGIITGGGILLFSLSMFAFLYKESWYKRVMPFCTWIVLLGIAAMLIGGIGINYYWHHEARSIGYVKCGLLDKLSTTQMHTSYWGKKKSYCNDIQAAKLVSGTSVDDLKKANDYLRKRE